MGRVPNFAIPSNSGFSLTWAYASAIHPYGPTGLPECEPTHMRVHLQTVANGRNPAACGSCPWGLERVSFRNATGSRDV